MNILLIVILALCALSMLYGYVRGFIRIVISLVATVATLIFVGMFTPYVTDLIVDYTPLDEAIELQFTTAMFGDDVFLATGDGSENLTLAEQIVLIEDADIPDFLKEATLDNNNNEIYEQLGVTTFAEYIGAYLSAWVISVLAYIITFLIAWCIVRAVVFSLDTIANLPILHGINRAIGTVLGLSFAVVIVWVFFLGLSIMYSTEIGQMCYEWIAESEFLTFLYDNNPIIDMLIG